MPTIILPTEAQLRQIEQQCAVPHKIRKEKNSFTYMPVVAAAASIIGLAAAGAVYKHFTAAPIAPAVPIAPAMPIAPPPPPLGTDKLVGNFLLRAAKKSALYWVGTAMQGIALVTVKFAYDWSKRQLANVVYPAIFWYLL